MKRITILERNYTQKVKNSWFQRKEQKVLFDLTDIKLNDEITKLNNEHKRNKFSITNDFDMKSVNGKKQLQYYIISTPIDKIPESLRKLKHLHIEIMREFMEG